MKKRIYAMLIDFLLSSLLVQLVSFTFDFFEIVIPYYSYVIIIIGVFLLIFKDVLYGNASIGKKILKIEVRMNDGQVPSLMKLIMRNLTIFIWPIECILILHQNKRIGDIIFKTSVVNSTQCIN